MWEGEIDGKWSECGRYVSAESYNITPTSWIYIPAKAEQHPHLFPLILSHGLDYEKVIKSGKWPQ